GVAPGDQSGLQRAGNGIEAGMQYRGVRLAGALANVPARLQQGDPDLEAGQLPRHGAADHAATDHGHVHLGEGVHRTRPESATTAWATTFMRRASPAHSGPSGNGASVTMPSKSDKSQTR